MSNFVDVRWICNLQQELDNQCTSRKAYTSVCLMWNPIIEVVLSTVMIPLGCVDKLPPKLYLFTRATVVRVLPKPTISELSHRSKRLQSVLVHSGGLRTWVNWCRVLIAYQTNWMRSTALFAPRICSRRQTRVITAPQVNDVPSNSVGVTTNLGGPRDVCGLHVTDRRFDQAGRWRNYWRSGLGIMGPDLRNSLALDNLL